jgi:hypothetical protein
VRHETAIGQLFGWVLELCATAGMVKVGVVAVDGTKIAAAATHHATRTYQQIAGWSRCSPYPAQERRARTMMGASAACARTHRVLQGGRA